MDYRLGELLLNPRAEASVFRSGGGMEGSVDTINGAVVFESVLAWSESASGAGRALAAVLMPPPGVGGMLRLELQPPRAVDGLIAARAWREIA